MNDDKTHLIVIKNPSAVAHLIEESLLIGLYARDGKPMGQGDALVGRDILQGAGYEWGKDFYLKILTK